MNDTKSREVHVDIPLSMEVNCVFQTKILAFSEHLEFHVVVVVFGGEWGRYFNNS